MEMEFPISSGARAVIPEPRRFGTCKRGELSFDIACR
jgi:hypothetical protein